MDANARLFVNLPVFTANTRHVVLDANAVAGTAEGLLAEIVSKHDAAYTTNLWANYGQKVNGLLICNADADPAYLRLTKTTAAAAGEGLPLASNDRIYLPMSGWPLDVMLYESKGSLSVFLLTSD